MTSSTTYEAAIAASRQQTGPVGAVESGDSELTQIDYRELIRLGSLAASSHNTQPWKFIVGDQTIRITPDFSRRCPVVDPDDAHLFKSLGCAAENIVHAAAAQGLRADVGRDEHLHALVIHLTPDSSRVETALARAIPSRQCTKSPYESSPLAPEQLAELARAGASDGVRVIFLTEQDQKSMVTEFVNRGNQAQLSDPDFRNELISWIRPNDRESLARGDGLSGRTTGQPSVPTWLARWLLPVVVRPKGQMKTDAANISASAGIAVFVTEDDGVAAWVEAGRCYERLALQATALHVRNAFINQPIEAASIRPEFERWLGLEDEHAQLMVRFGTGSEMPFSIRRPIDEVMVDGTQGVGLSGVQ